MQPREIARPWPWHGWAARAASGCPARAPLRAAGRGVSKSRPGSRPLRSGNVSASAKPLLLPRGAISHTSARPRLVAHAGPTGDTQDRHAAQLDRATLGCSSVRDSGLRRGIQKAPPVPLTHRPAPPPTPRRRRRRHDHHHHDLCHGLSP